MTKFLDPCNDVAFKKVFGSENHKRMSWNQDEIIAYDRAFIDATAKQGELELARTEGKAEGKLEIARQMLTKKLDTSMIADLTGLTIEEIAALTKPN